MSLYKKLKWLVFRLLAARVYYRLGFFESFPAAWVYAGGLFDIFADGMDSLRDVDYCVEEELSYWEE